MCVEFFKEVDEDRVLFDRYINVGHKDGPTRFMIYCDGGWEMHYMLGNETVGLIDFDFDDFYEAMRYHDTVVYRRNKYGED